MDQLPTENSSELYTSTREEFLFHLRQRDEWLKYQLITQGTLFALVNGIELTIAKAEVPKLEILGFSILISLIFGSLYFTEDHLIGYLSKFLVRLHKSSQVYIKESIDCIEGSGEMKDYIDNIRPFRDLTSFVIFLIIPLYLGFIRFSGVENWNALTIGELLIDIILIGVLLVLVVRTFTFRRGVAK